MCGKEERRIFSALVIGRLIRCRRNELDRHKGEVVRKRERFLSPTSFGLDMMPRMKISIMRADFRWEIGALFLPRTAVQQILVIYTFPTSIGVVLWLLCC